MNKKFGKGFKNALLVAAMLSVGASSVFADTEIKNDSMTTKRYKADSSSTTYFVQEEIYGHSLPTGSSDGDGVIYLNNNSANLNIFKNAHFHNNSGRTSGIYVNAGTLNVTDANFYSNTSSYNNASTSGGIFNKGTTSITAATQDVIFYDNKVTGNNSHGGAIQNQGTLNLYATGGNIIFGDDVLGHNINATSGASDGVYLYNSATMNVDTSATYSVKFNDAVSSNNTSSTITKTGTGAMVLNNDMSGYKGAANINAGTVKLGTSGTFFTGSSLNTFEDGTILDTQNGAIEATNLGKIKLNGDVTVKLDVNTTAGSTDTYTAASYTGTGNLIVDAINMTNIGTGTEISFTSTIADSNLRDHISFTGGTSISGSTATWSMGYEASTGVLTMNVGSSVNNIKDAINSDTLTEYHMGGNETLTDNIGAMGAKSSMTIDSTVSGTKRTVSGANTYAGMEIGSGKSMTIKDVAFDGFEKDGNGGVIYNSGTLTLNNVDFTDNSATYYGGALYNEGEIGDTTDLTKTAISGNFIGNTATSNGGALYNGGTIGTLTGNFTNNIAGNQGGAIRNDATITKIANATFGSATDNTKGNRAKSGGVISNGSTIKTISADFYYNQATNYGGAIVNWGTIGDATDLTKTAISGNFIGNTATDNGGAICNSGTITKISDATFGSSTDNTKGNTAADGGAIFNDGTINSLSADFYYNSATEDGGAIYNAGTITTLTGNFTGNTASSDGGAICNAGIIGDTSDLDKVAISGTFAGNIVSATVDDIISGGAIANYPGSSRITNINANFTNNVVALSSSSLGSLALGGAITCGNLIDSVKGNFTGNKAIGFESALGGGAAVANRATMTIVDSTFTNNLASTLGGAILNGKMDSSDAGSLTISAVGDNVTFSGNKQGVSFNPDYTPATAGSSNAIYNTAGCTVTFNASSGRSIILNDSLADGDPLSTGFATPQWNKTGAGALVLNNSMSGVLGDVEIKGGTVKIDSTTGGTFFNAAHNTTFNGTDLTLDTQDGTVNATALGTLTMNSDVAMKIDVNTTAGTGDTFSATAVSGTGEFVLSAGNMINVGTGTEASFSYEIADSVLRSHINETVSGSEIVSSAKGWAIGYSKSSGVLTFTASDLGIKAYINDDTHTSYTLNDNETVSDNIGAMGEKASMLIESTTGNKFTVDGGSNAGMEIGLYSGNPQSMTINNVAFDGFEKDGNGGVIYNQGTLTLDNVDFTGNSATGYAGAIYNGGTITTIKNATFGGTGTGEGNSAKSGGAIYNYSDQTIYSISADFINNSAINGGFCVGGAIANFGIIGNTSEGHLTDTAISGTFKGNTVLLGAGFPVGGAIYNGGTITAIKNATFGGTGTGEGNSAKSGGAIYNNTGKTIYSISADFINNSATNAGGAIYNQGTIGNTSEGHLTDTAISGTFKGNTATSSSGGAIYNGGTITTIKNATFGGTGSGESNSAGFGGAFYNNYMSTTYSIFADFINNSATNDGGGAIYNWGTIGDTTDSTKTAISGNFIGNTATSNGGALYNGGTIGTLTGNFTNNIAGNQGGAIRNDATITKIADATFGSATDNTKGNTAANGGAISNNNGTIKSISADFYYNKATNGDGGAIYNWGTIGDTTDSTKTAISGNFIGNTATGSGGAIRNYSTITKIADTTFGSSTDNTKGNTAARGGAISNNGTINSLSADFYYNKATDGNGGAINNYGTISTLTGNFTGNSATVKGGAIYNDNNGTITIKTSDTADITFSGNTANGISNAIHNQSGTVTFDGTKNIIMNDSLTGTTSGNYVKQGTGALVLKNDMSGVQGNVDITAGTVQLTNNGTVKGTLFSNANKTTWTGGTTLDAQNTYTEEISLGQSAELLGNVNAKIDVDLTGTDTTAADHFSAGSEVTGTGKIVLNTVVANVLTNISETSTVTPPIDGSTIIRKIADDNVRNSIQLGSDVKFKGLLANGGDYKWLVTYSRDTGNLTFANGWSLKEAINYKNGAYQSDIDVIYNATEDETTGTIGNLGGNKTTVNMNGYAIDGDGGSGIVVQNANQELVINDANVSNFSSTDNGAFINDQKGATITIANSSFDSITTTGSSKNGGVIYAKNGITATDTSFTNNSATNGYGGAIYHNKGITNIDATVDGMKFTGNSAKSGGAIYENDNSSTISINKNGGDKMITFGGTGTGEGNSATGTGSGDGGGAIRTQGNFSANNVSFVNNSASNYGGAIYHYNGNINLGATIDNVKFTGNSAKSGGAIYNNGSNESPMLVINGNNETKTITFGGTGTGEGNSATGTGSNDGGGAIYTRGAMSANNVSFVNNTAANNGGAIYIYGKGTSINATVEGTKFAGNSAKSGGAIYNSGNSGSKININSIDNTKTIAFTSNSATNGSGGAIYIGANAGNSIANAIFKSNTATSNGGAIYNNGTIGDENDLTATAISATFGGSGTGEGNSAANGGAIYNNGTITNITGDFVSNSATSNGGAIYNAGSKTINAITGNFTNNSATNLGGAIYNEGTITLKADTNNITFSGNTDSTGSNDIYNKGTLNINTSEGKNVSFAGGISSDNSTSRIVNKNGAGTLLINGADMSNFKGKVNFNGGTVKIENSGKFFSGANQVDVASSGILLDVKNGAANDQIDLGNLKLTNDLNIAVDVDLSNGNIDNFTSTGTITGNKNIIIETVAANMKAINDLPASVYPQTTTEGTEYSSRRVVTQIADASVTGLAGKFKLADRISLDVREDIDGSTNNHPDTGWFMYYNNTTGQLHFIDQSLRTTLKDTADDVKKYIMAANETVESHLDNIVGTSVQIIGTKQGSDPNNYAIYGSENRGVVVASGQTLTIDDVSEVSGFTNSFMDVRSGANGAVDNVTFKNAVTDTDVNGAAILNAGTTTVDNSTFNGNTAGNGGAVYNTGTITVENSTFTNNGVLATDGKGGALYNSGTSSVVNLNNVKFEAPTGTNANDIYNEGTVNVTGGTTSDPNKFASNIVNGGTMNVQTGSINNFSGDIDNTGNITFNGTNTISGAINATATGDNKVAFTGTNTLTSSATMTGDMALTNSGALELNSDLSGYTGDFTQTAGSTNVKSTATLFGGTNTVTGGTMALDGTLASNLDIQGGTVTSTTGTLAGTSSTTVNGGTFNMSGGKAENGSTIDVNSGNMNFTGGNLESGSNTTVDGGTMTMNGGTVDDGATVTLTSGTVDYQSGTVDGTLKADGGDLKVNGDLTIKGDSYVKDASNVDIASGKTLSVENLSPSNTTGVQLNEGDTWSGNVNVGTDGILSVTDIVNGSLTQTAGTSTFNNAVLDMANANISGGDVNLASQSVLNYVSGTTFSPENLNLSGSSTMQMMNNIAGETLTLNNVSTDGTNNIKLDINPNAGKFDTVAINGNLSGTNSGALYVADFNYIGGTPTEKDYKFQLFDVNGTTSNVDFLSSDKEFKSAIGNYRIMSNGGGAYTFGLTSYNPQVYRGQVATMAAYNNQINIDNIVLDQFILQNNVLPTAKTANRYTSAQSLFSPYQHTPEEGGLWYKSYVDFETLTFNHGLKSHNTAYGALLGADLPLVHLKRGWDFIPTFYVGYNGATQDFSKVTMYQNGGQGGFMGTFIHNDFIGSIMAYGGGYGNEMDVNGEKDRTGNWFAGTATKLAYNFHPTKHFIIQPTAFVSYNIFGKQHWNSDFGAVGMNSGLLNGINVAPGLNLIYKRDTWSVYATFQYMYNINEQVSGRAANIDIPSLKMRHGYFQYGIGATKTWKDRLASYFQFNIRNGGRTGVGFQLGVKYLFDWNLKSKSKTKTPNPTTSSSAQRRILKG